MATTKKTAARKTTAKKTVARNTTAKKTGARKTAAKKSTAARKTAAASTPTAVRDTISSVANEADDTLKQYGAVAGDQLGELRQLVRDVVDIYVGIPFVLGARLGDSATTPNVDVDALKSLLDDVRSRLAEVPSVDFDAVKAFVDEAKTVGHARVTAFENQVVEAVETGRARLRNLYAA